MNVSPISRTFLSTSPYVFRFYNSHLPMTGEKRGVFQKTGSFKDSVALEGTTYAANFLAAANSLSLYYLPTTVAHDNSCGCL